MVRFLLADVLFKHGCLLPHVGPGLEMRQGHDLQDLSSGAHLPHSSTLLMRCQDQTAAMSGAAITQCQDAIWSHRLPVCRRTAGPGEYSGETASLQYFQPAVLGLLGVSAS